MKKQVKFGDWHASDNGVFMSFKSSRRGMVSPDEHFLIPVLLIFEIKKGCK